jgi:hypothetical protein
MSAPTQVVIESEYENPEKLQARAEGVRIYRELTGRTSIPVGKQYWTLAALQTTNLTSEICQMVALGLLTKDQFYGADDITELIEQNKINHPEAHWFAGDWYGIIARDDFNPELIYLDLTSMADSPFSADITYRTMKSCPADTVLLVNVALTNPWSGHETEIEPLLENVTDKMTEAECSQWNLTDFPMFKYCGSGSTVMCTVGFRKGI